MSSNHQSLYKFKEFRLDVAERLLLRNDLSVPLMPKVFDVLTLLVERNGHLVEKDELLRVVWEDAFVEEANVARVVHSLRRILGENSDNKFIETVSKKGYRFVAEVEQTNGVEPAENGNLAETYTPSRDDCVNYVLQTGDDLVRVEDLNGHHYPEAAGEVLFSKNVSDQSTIDSDSGPRTAKFWIPGALAVLILFIIGVWFYDDVWSVSESKNKSKSIAVLPLKPISNGSRDSIYELGIAESLILKLSSGKGMTVRPLSATRKYLELEQNPTEAGREQQVDFVLSSNYQIADGKIRVTSQLINTQTGNVEEVFKSEKDIASVFLMQDAIANDIGNTLLAQFGKRENNLTAKRGTSNEEAYRLYLQAAFIFDQWHKAEIGRAVGYLEKAVELDPNFADAYVFLAYAYRFASHKGVEESSDEQYLKSKKAIEKALALDENLGDAYAVLGLLKVTYEGDFAGAEKEFKRAVELNPDSPMVRALYAYFLMMPGRFDEAIAQNKKAMEVDPGSLSHQITHGMILYYARRYDDAVAHYQRLLDKDKNFAYAYFWIWLLCDLQGNEAGAYEWFMKYQTQMKAAPELIALYKTAYQKAGWKGILREIISQDEKKIAKGEQLDLTYEVACFNARLGNREKAFEYLDKTYQRHSSLINFVKVDPYLDSLHGDPRFEKLVRQVGL